MDSLYGASYQLSRSSYPTGTGQAVLLWLASANPCAMELKFGILYGCYDTGIGQYWGWLLLAAYLLPLVVWLGVLPRLRGRWPVTLVLYFGVLWGSWWYYTNTVDRLSRTLKGSIIHSFIAQAVALVCIALVAHRRRGTSTPPQQL
jgi:hypothetical protein